MNAGMLLRCLWIISIQYQSAFSSCEIPITKYDRQIGRVVQQLQSRPYYLFLYLDALFDKDPHLLSSFADLQVRHVVPKTSLDTHLVGLGETLCSICYFTVNRFPTSE
jgi:hypothetical protein